MGTLNGGSRPRAAHIATLLIAVCCLLGSAAPAGAAPWKDVSGGTDSVLIDMQTAIDGISHAVFLQHRTNDAGTAAYDLLDRPMGSNGSLAQSAPIVTGWTAINGARLIPTARGLLAIVVGDPDGQHDGTVQAFRSPLGGGTWSQVAFANAYELSGDTFFSSVVQDYLGIPAAKLTQGPPIAPMPDGSLLFTRLPYDDEITIRRVLGNDATFTIDMKFPDGVDCGVSRAVPAVDANGAPVVVYDVGSPVPSDKKGCASAAYRQALDPSTLAPAGPPVQLSVPAAIGGDGDLDVQSGTFGGLTPLTAFSGPDGNAWAVHGIQVLPGGKQHKPHPTPGQQLSEGFDETTKLMLWNAAGKSTPVPLFSAPGHANLPDEVSFIGPDPIVRGFSDGIVVVYNTSSDVLLINACAYWKDFYALMDDLDKQLAKLTPAQKKKLQKQIDDAIKNGKPPPHRKLTPKEKALSRRLQREYDKCPYKLFKPDALVVGRYAGGRWTMKEIAGPQYPKGTESMVATRFLGTSSKSFDLALEDETPTGKPNPKTIKDFFASKGGVVIRHITF
ncbi:MAG: hypothetical protein QOG68_754 [Solirubrobacteraceae bacterium]|nr:hypothetical protein [Solirubrobacteraceae bacterium]